MGFRTDIVDGLIAKTLSGELHWRYTYYECYDCSTVLPDGTRASLIVVNNFFRCLAHGKLFFHTPSKNIITGNINGETCSRLLDAILGSPSSINMDRINRQRDSVDADNIAQALR